MLGFSRVNFGQEQQKERVQLKVAAWALFKEANVASGNVVSSPSAIVPEKEVKSEERKNEDEDKKLHKTPHPSSVLGLDEERPFVWREGPLRKTLKVEKEQAKNLGGVVTPGVKHNSEHDFFNIKTEVQFGEEKKEEKSFLYEEDNSEDIENEDEVDTKMVVDDNVDAKYVQHVIAGRENVNFIQFKRLMEDGHLKKEDLNLMRSARVVQVPGKGEVVQFLASSKKEFNRINLKELGLDDVGPSAFSKKMRRIIAKTQLPRFILDLISKKGSKFRCNTCQTVHANVASAKSHINIKHGDMLVKSGAYANVGAYAIPNVIVMVLNKICDPSLLIEQVVITNNGWKQMRKRDSAKNHQINIYQRAADLLAAFIQVERAPTPGKGKVYHCKPCSVDISSSNWRKDGEKRWGCVNHLADTHSKEYQDFAVRLHIAPGPRLDHLLFQALLPGLIYNAKKPY